jgi:hypothetical protein
MPNTRCCPMKVGDRVEKLEGYKWPGIVVAIFTNTNHERRVVVECDAEAVAGALHIYSPEQLRVINEDG